MGYKGQTSVELSKLQSIVAEFGAKWDEKSYVIVTKPGVENQQVLLERSLPKGSTVAKCRWIELRGKGKTPYNSSTPGVVPHDHSSPSIKWRLNTDESEEKILANFRLLIASLMGVKIEEPKKSEEAAPQAEVQVEQAAA